MIDGLMMMMTIFFFFIVLIVIYLIDDDGGQTRDYDHFLIMIIIMVHDEQCKTSMSMTHNMISDTDTYDDADDNYYLLN